MPRSTSPAEPRRTGEPFVLSRTGDGCLVYAASDPQHVYLVAGSPDAPTCTCPDFRARFAEAGYRCAHIAAATPASPEDALRVHDVAEERAAIQAESRPRKTRGSGAASNGHAPLIQMILKRSVSPDGRIDALSVELACPIDGLAPEAIEARAASALDIQTRIVRAFAGSKPPANGGNGHDKQASSAPPTGRVPATLLGVGGMDGKWGRRLFLNVQVNGRNSKLFGSVKQLEAVLDTAGYPEVGIEEGATLNLPCQVIAAPSPDGRYLNIVQVFPENATPVRRSA